MNRRKMILPFDPRIADGSWIMAPSDEPLLQGVEGPEATGWTIHLTDESRVWVPFHLIDKDLRVYADES